MKINIKKIIFFLVIIYGILICNSMCFGNNDCEECKKRMGDEADNFKHQPMSINDVLQLRSKWRAATWHVEGTPGAIEVESQKTGEKKNWIEANGNSDQKFGLSNDQYISVRALRAGSVWVWYDPFGFDKKKGTHIIIKDLRDNQENTVNATILDVTSDPTQYNPTDIDTKSASKIENATSKILTIISNIGIAVSVIILAILGVKYMLGSVEDKAEYKQDMIPYLIGVLLLFGITGFLKILIAIGEKISAT